MSSNAMEKRKEFKDDAAKLFDVSKKDAVEEIQKDRLRSEDDKKEDVKFLMDQRSNREMKMSGKDKKYSERVDRKVDRESRAKAMAESESLLQTTRSVRSTQEIGQEDNVNHDTDEEFGEDEDDDDDDFICPEGPSKKKKKKSSTVVEIPANIAELTAENALRRGISATAHASLIANVVNVAGGDISELSVSTSTMRRAGRKAVKEKASSIRDRFAELNDKKTKIIHFDGKNVEELTNNVVMKNERMAVLVSSCHTDWVRRGPAGDSGQVD